MPEAVIEAVGLFNTDTSENDMVIASEEACGIKEVLEEGGIDVIRNNELAWKTLCVILYDKTQYLIEEVTNSADFIEFFKECTNNNYLELEFVPEDSRNSPFYNEVLRNMQIMKRISTFLAKANVLGLKYKYVAGGTVLLPSSDEWIIKDLKDERVLFQCKYIIHIDNSRLFKFSHDHNLWGLVDDLGRIVAKEVFQGFMYW